MGNDDAIISLGGLLGATDFPFNIIVLSTTGSISIMEAYGHQTVAVALLVGLVFLFIGRVATLSALDQ
jgi:hypothetical protein